MTETPISSLAKIEKPPPHPMTLFKEYLKEAETYLEDTFLLFNLATCNSNNEVLNRTLVLRGHDDDGIVFVTERNSRKFHDIQTNPNVSASFLWCYKKQDGRNELTKHQVRFTGVASELSTDEIRKFYDDEPINYKIRSVIARCGEPVEWETVKRRHDEALNSFLESHEAPKQTDTYTVMKIKPTTVDFYHSVGANQMADRVVYRLSPEERWRQEHVYA